MADWRNRPGGRAGSFDKEMGDIPSMRGLIQSQGFTYDFGDEEDLPRFRPQLMETIELQIGKFKQTSRDDSFFDAREREERTSMRSFERDLRERSPIGRNRDMRHPEFTQAREQRRRSLSPDFGRPNHIERRDWLQEEIGFPPNERVDLMVPFASEEGEDIIDGISNVILLSGLPHDTLDIDLYPFFYPNYERLNDVRLFKNDGGCSGKASVRFFSADQAEKWMNITKDKMMIRNKKIDMEFKFPSERTLRKFGSSSAWEKWVTDKPSKSLVMWNLPSCAEIGHVRQKFGAIGIGLQSCKIMRKNEQNHGYGFLDFGEAVLAQQWRQEYKGVFELRGNVVMTAFSTGGSRAKPWICTKCLTDNFKDRVQCFNCSARRSVSELSTDGANEVGMKPCNTLIFRGLDALTIEDNILESIEASTGITCKRLQVMRDPRMGLSMSYAFAEMASMDDARRVVNIHGSEGSPLEIGGKQIMVSYARNAFSHIIATKVAAGQGKKAAAHTLEQPSHVTEMEDISTDEEMLEMEPEPEPEPLPQPVKRKAQTVASEKRTPMERPKKETTKKKAPPPKKVYITPKGKPGVNYLNVKMVQMTNYLYDPQTDTYYDKGSDVPCPVADCYQKGTKDWMGLQRHWLSVHLPTKKVYFCRRKPCKHKPKPVQYTINSIRTHLKTHGHIKLKDLDEEIIKTKSRNIPNLKFIDPGTEVLPPPFEVTGPTIDIPETECPVKKCSGKYTTMESMRQHWNHYHSPMVTMYRCGLCDTIDRDKEVMTSHMTEAHAGAKVNLDKVKLTSKRFIDPEDVVPFWALYDSRSDEKEDEDDIDGNEDRLGPDFPLVKIPEPGNDPEDLLEFVSWTERYMHRLHLAHLDATGNLKKIVSRQLDSKQ